MPGACWPPTARPSACCRRARSQFSADQEAFLEQAVAGLAEEGKVVSVRVSLFAEMFKGRAWTTAALARRGDGRRGVNFLEETFSAPSADPKHRYHQVAARAVLKDLLPEEGTEIKGQMALSRGILPAASTYQGRPQDFNELMRILDGELRLVTPTDPGCG